MDTSTVAGQQVFFQTSIDKITKGSFLYLDIGPGKVGKDGKEYLGFSPIKPQKYCGAFKRKERPILIFRIRNTTNFKPETAGERWEVFVEEIEITNNLTGNKQFQRVLIHLIVIGRVEHPFQFYDEKKKQYVIETRSGRVIISQNFFATEEETVEYRDQHHGEPMISELRNIYAKINGERKLLICQIPVGAVSKSFLVGEKTSEIAQEALRKGRHGNSRDFRARAEKEVEEYFAGLPEMPARLKELK